MDQRLELSSNILKFLTTKKFATRGTTFAKKMWRDGYNKALDDIYNLIISENEREPSTIRPNDGINYDRQSSLRESEAEETEQNTDNS